MITDVRSMVISLEKQATSAALDGKNRAYGKGIRDAIKIIQEYDTEKYETTPIQGGIPRENISWYECGTCNWGIDPGDKYCRGCGRMIRWKQE